MGLSFMIGNINATVGEMKLQLEGIKQKIPKLKIFINKIIANLEAQLFIGKPVIQTVSTKSQQNKQTRTKKCFYLFLDKISVNTVFAKCFRQECVVQYVLLAVGNLVNSIGRKG